jgi:hypothetical protein
MTVLRTLYVVATSAITAEGRAKCDPGHQHVTADDAREWLESWSDRRAASHFKVFEVTERATCDGSIWIARRPISAIGAVARAACVVIGFGLMLASVGVGSIV